MTTFSENHISFPDGQYNVVPLPEAIMRNGFIPETRDAPGMPLPAQYLNWLFRDVYRQLNQLQSELALAQSQAVPAWVPLPIPLDSAPAGYLKCDGSAFDMGKYPELAKGYPTGFLPDLRGEFIRGLDDGRGVDVGREVISSQGDAMRNITGNIGNILWPSDQSGGMGNGEFAHAQHFAGMAFEAKADAQIDSGENNDEISFDAPRVVATATENLPRNIAFLYVVRAA